MIAKSINVLGRLLIISNDYVLVTKKKVDDYVFLPGGHVEYNEGVKTTIIRELQEEMGADVEVGKFIGVLEKSFENKDKGAYHELNFIFIGKLKGQDYPQTPESLEDAQEVKWIPINELRKANLLPSQMIDIINDYKKSNQEAIWISTME